MFVGWEAYLCMKVMGASKGKARQGAKGCLTIEISSFIMTALMMGMHIKNSWSCIKVLAVNLL
jgi:hypothetical protein